MNVAIVLLTYATLLGWAAYVPLARARWTARAPRLAIWAWQALSATAVTSVALAGLALAIPVAPVSANLGTVLEACASALRAGYAAPGGTGVAAAGAALAVLVAARATWCLAAGLATARRERSRHARTLALVGRYEPELGVTVVRDARPAAYCLPGHGPRPRIVLTSTALAALDPESLAAVIAHERAHISQRHHLVLAWAGALERAFPYVPLFRTAATELRRLVELAADDAATTRTNPLTLAAALLHLAAPPDGGTSPPSPALAASSGHVASRVRRLLKDRRPLGRLTACAIALAAGALLVTPFAIAAQPAVTATTLQVCPLPPAPAPG